MAEEQKTVKTESEIQEEKIRAKARKQKRKARVKKTFYWLLVLALIGTIVYFAAFKKPKAADDGTSNQIQREAKVIRDVYTMDIDLSGYVSPYDIQKASFRTTGPVNGVYVEEGDKVTKGQKLASIDSISYQIAVIQAENDLKKAQLSGSEKDIQLAEMSLQRAKNNLAYTDIVANFDGVVASVNVSEGDYYEAGNATAITIVDVSKLIATVDIDEIDMQYVKVGQSVDLTFDSLPGQTVKGYVSYIPMLGEYSSQGIGIVKVEVTIDNPPAGLTPGFSFEGKISVSGDVEMLLVNQSAISTGRGGVTSVTRKKADGTTETVNIGVKYLGEGYAQVISGDLKEGDVVVYNQNASTGMAGMMGGISMGGAPGGAPQGGRGGF